MSGEKTGSKAGRPSRTLEEEIFATEQRLQQLKAKKRDDERRKLELNQKAIMALLKSAGLDAVEAEAWQKVLPKIKDLLEAPKSTKVDKQLETSPVYPPVYVPKDQAATTA